MDQLRRSGGAGEAVLLVADSWLVTDGQVRALHEHRDRFTTACREAAPGPTGADPYRVGDRSQNVDPDQYPEPERDLGPGLDLGAFWSAVVERLPRSGQFFPRVELVRHRSHRHRREPGRPAVLAPAAVPDPALELRLRVRPAPGLTDTVRVWVSGQPDPRRAPRRKGPDLDRLAELRQAAAAHGAGEALLTTASGVLLEAANSSLLWWEDDVLCVPAPALRLLPGVTSGLIQREAARRGIAVRHRRSRLADLAGREVWLVNALHGIRPVTGWAGPAATTATTGVTGTTGAAVPVGPAPRAAEWRAWLHEQRAPLPDPA